MEHRHTNMRTGPVSKSALCKNAKQYCSFLFKRLRKSRIDDSKPYSNKYGFNIPKVVVSCTSDVAPYFICRGRNNKTLKNPHPTLQAAYPPHRSNGLPVKKSIPNVDYYPVGHCAEPHAAHILLNNMAGRGKPIKINNIVFSLAYRVKNQSVVPYCGTCRLTFPQLK